MYVFLDGIEIEMDTIIKRSEKGENFFGFGETEPRNAIRKYGEKYRGGIVFFESNK